jgi:hypothetical protein
MRSADWHGGHAGMRPRLAHREGDAVNIKVFVSAVVPEGCAYVVSPPTPEDERAMEGLSFFERVKWLAEHGKLVKVVGLSDAASHPSSTGES